MRRSEGCLNCGEVREIAAHGLCFACYRRKERAEDRQFAGVDRHSPAIRREHKKMFRGFTNLMAGLSDLGVSREDVFAIRRTIDAYLTPIAKFLAPPQESEEGATHVNGEHKSPEQFTVHSDWSQEQSPRTFFFIRTDPSMSDSPPAEFRTIEISTGTADDTEKNDRGAQDSAPAARSEGAAGPRTRKK